MTSDDKCKTPGAIFHTSIKDKGVGVTVSLPMTLNITEKEATRLENKMHDAMESILGKYFK